MLRRLGSSRESGGRQHALVRSLSEAQWLASPCSSTEWLLCACWNYCPRQERTPQPGLEPTSIACPSLDVPPVPDQGGLQVRYGLRELRMATAPVVYDLWPCDPESLGDLVRAHKVGDGDPAHHPLSLRQPSS
jgi:hypothetical protein